VGETGRVIGVDMTAEMIEKARQNKERLGVENVEFRLGEIENLPAADNSVDVIISNCVINLSPDKQQVLDEAFRVLKPGGYLAVSDIVTDGPLPQPIKDSLSAWAGCISGALDLQEYKRMLHKAGFEEVSVVPEYWDEKIITDTVEGLKEQGSGEDQPRLVINDGVDTKIIPVEKLDVDPKTLTKTIFSARIKAVKPTG